MRLRSTVVDKPKIDEYTMFIVTQRIVDSVKYNDDGEPVRLYRLSNDSLVWIKVSRRIFPGDTLKFKK